MSYTYTTQYQNTLNYDLSKYDIILSFNIMLINAVVNITTFSENILIPELSHNFIGNCTKTLSGTVSNTLVRIQISGVAENLILIPEYTLNQNSTATLYIILYALIPFLIMLPFVPFYIYFKLCVQPFKKHKEKIALSIANVEA